LGGQVAEEQREDGGNGLHNGEPSCGNPCSQAPTRAPGPAHSPGAQ